jgi:hypothetical protein
LVKPDARPGKVDTQVWYFKDDQSNSITGNNAYDNNTILTTKQLTITTETVDGQQVKVAYIKDAALKAKLDTATQGFENESFFPAQGAGSVQIIQDT